MALTEEEKNLIIKEAEDLNVNYRIIETETIEKQEVSTYSLGFPTKLLRHYHYLILIPGSEFKKPYEYKRNKNGYTVASIRQWINLKLKIKKVQEYLQKRLK